MHVKKKLRVNLCIPHKKTGRGHGFARGGNSFVKKTQQMHKGGKRGQDGSCSQKRRKVDAWVIGKKETKGLES